MVKSNCFGESLRDSIKMDNNYEILMMKYQDNPRMIGSPSISSGGRGFRLGQQNVLDLNSTSVIERASQKFDKSSICSGSIASCKQKIDAMFETQSVQSHPIGLKTSLINANDGEDSDESINQNNIQMKIDKMFSEIHNDFDKKDEESTDSDSRTSHCYHVDYLGSISLNNRKISSLESLQEPLKNLYFNYVKSLENNRGCNLMSSLEITSTGLRISCREREQTNPFATIAVWAAVKFVCRPRSLNHGKEFGMEYSFVPLISNQDPNDKAALFQRLTSTETLIFENRNSDNLPIFVVVMKKLASKQLECHGFVCDSNELAITIAAKLYKALVRAMSEPNSKHKLKHFNGLSSMSVSSSSDVNRLEKNQNGKPRLKRTDGGIRESSRESNASQFHRNQNRRSLRSNSSMSNRGNEGRFQEVTVVIENDRTPNMPRSSHAPKSKEDFSKPPRRPPKSNSIRSSSGSISSATKVTQTDFNDIRPRRPKPDQTGHPKSFRSPVNEINQNLRRSASERCPSGVQSMMDTQSGDIFTKVAIPRSRSFLNANGPFVTNYNRPSRNHPSSDLSKKVKESSPLGFNEIFTELQNQEGLNSMDDILNAIINREGMSFNDLKPIYKEFLLKLALTLTKDELYERSKLIMQRQKVLKKQKRKRSKSSSITSLSLKNAFRKSVSKLNQRKKKCKKRGGTLEFTSGVFPADKHKKSKSDYTDTSVTTWSSYFSRKRPSVRASRRPSFKVAHRKARSSRRPSQRKAPHSTSEDSDFFSLIRCDKSQRNGDCFHQSSSGYFSYSECSCNTESCSCSSATKCYCSLAQRPRPRSQKRSQPPLLDSGAMSLSSCDCDTDSCVESEKCYCNNLRNLSAFEQLKQQGFAASDSSLSRAASPTTAWQKNESTTRSRPGHLGAQSSKSLEFVQFSRTQSQKGGKKGSYFNRMEVYDSLNYKNHPSSSSFSYHNASSQASTINSQRKSLSSDNLALDYDMFSSSKGKQPRGYRKEKKVLVVSARDSKGRIIYLDSGRPENGRQRSLTRSNSHMTATEALSVKKSAEIAALFSNSTSMQKCISQPYKVTRDAVIYNAIQSPDSCIVQGNEPHYLKHSNLENSLGYYP